jgi:hypothetical protein
MSLPDGSNIQVYRNQAAVIQAAAVLNTTSAGAAPAGSSSGSPASQTAPRQIARAVAASPAHRQGQTTRSRRIFW